MKTCLALGKRREMEEIKESKIYKGRILMRLLMFVIVIYRLLEDPRVRPTVNTTIKTRGRNLTALQLVCKRPDMDHKHKALLTELLLKAGFYMAARP